MVPGAGEARDPTEAARADDGRPGVDAAALARALEQALASPAAPEPGRTHAAGFSWDRCAQEHADFLRELYDRKRAVRR